MITIKEPIEDTINAAIDRMNINATISTWNDYCRRDSNFDDMIYNNTPSFFYENYSEDSMWQLVRDVSHGNYNSNHDLICYSKCTGYLNSFDHLCDELSPYDQSSLVNWLIRTYGDNIEEISHFLGVDLTADVDENDSIYIVGDKTYKFCADDDLVCCCNHCCFHQGKMCAASDLYDAGALPQCDEDGIGNGYWIEVEDEIN